MTDITSYFSDYVKSEVMEALVEKLGYSKEKAEEALFTGGLKIYSTINVEMQKQLEDVYDNFTEILVGNTDKVRGGPVLIDWRLNKAGNIIDESGNTIYYHQDNLLNEDSNLVIENGTYNINDNGDIIINNKKN